MQVFASPRLRAVLFGRQKRLIASCPGNADTGGRHRMGDMKFSIRDILWLTAIAAMFCGWWVERSGQISMRRERDSAVTRLTRLTEFLQSRGLDVFVDGRRQRVVMWRTDGGNLPPESVAKTAIEPNGP
jgi:hypothetical protein